MKSFSGVSPPRNFSDSVSKSSNSRWRIGMTWPGTSSRTSGLLSDPARPAVVEGSIPPKYQNPPGIYPFCRVTTDRAADRGPRPPGARSGSRATAASRRAPAGAPCRVGTARRRPSGRPPPRGRRTSRGAPGAGGGSPAGGYLGPGLLGLLVPAHARAHSGAQLPALGLGRRVDRGAELAGPGDDRGRGGLVEPELADPLLDGCERAVDRVLEAPVAARDLEDPPQLDLH